MDRNITDPIAESAAERGVMLPDEAFEDPREPPPGYENTIDELYSAIESALVNDKPMDPEEVRDFWNDMFLTNVIVPFLDHLRLHNLTDIRANLRNPVSGDIYRARTIWTENVLALDRVIHILEEWRG